MESVTKAVFPTSRAGEESSKEDKDTREIEDGKNNKCCVMCKLQRSNITSKMFNENLKF